MNIRLRNLVIIFILFNLVGVQAYSQSKAEVQKMKFVMEKDKGKKHYEIAKKNTNEISFVFSTLFIFYKEFFSSQDKPSCNFTPSCSEYALISIRKKGLVLGVLSTFDRLSRCNGKNHDHYEMDEKTGLLIDAVE